MSEENIDRQRRDVIKSAGLGTVSGIAVLTGASASGLARTIEPVPLYPNDTYGSEYTFTEDLSSWWSSTERKIITHLGSGLEIVSAEQKRDNDGQFWQYAINVAGNIWMEDHNGEQPSSGSWRKQGVIVEEDDPRDTSLFVSSDPKESGVFPEPEAANIPDIDFGSATGAMGIAAAVAGSGGTALALSAASLASDFVPISFDSGSYDETADVTQIHPTGFQKGGHNLYCIIKDYGGSSSIVVTSFFGGTRHRNRWRLNFNTGDVSVEEL